MDTLKIMHYPEKVAGLAACRPYLDLCKFNNHFLFYFMHNIQKPKLSRCQPPTWLAENAEGVEVNGNGSDRGRMFATKTEVNMSIDWMLMGC
jgi:hypothetical protein